MLAWEGFDRVCGLGREDGKIQCSVWNCQGDSYA